jgi:hypothetical protein
MGGFINNKRRKGTLSLLAPLKANWNMEPQLISSLV